MSKLFLSLIVLVTLSSLNNSIYSAEYQKLTNSMNRINRDALIDRESEVSDSDNEDLEDNLQNSILDEDAREELIFDLLKKNGAREIGFSNIMKLTQCTTGFTSENLHKLVDLAKHIAGDKIISVDSLFLAFYQLKPNVDIPLNLRDMAISKYFLNTYKLTTIFPSLYRLNQISQTNVSFNFLDNFFKKLKRLANFKDVEINEAICSEVLDTIIKSHNIKDFNPVKIIIPSTKDINNFTTPIPDANIRFKQDNRFQLSVSDQMASNGGGSLSCGYHVVKNCLMVTAALHSNDNSLLRGLNSNEPIDELFGENISALRKYIINTRNSNLLLKLYCDILLTKFLRGNKRFFDQIQRPEGPDNLVFKLNFGNKWVVFDTINQEEDQFRFKIRESLPYLIQTMSAETYELLNQDIDSIAVRAVNNLKIIFNYILKRNAQSDEKISHERLNNLDYIKSFFPTLQSDIDFIIEDETIRGGIINNNQIEVLEQIPENIYSQEIGRNGQLLGENLNGKEISKLYLYLANLGDSKKLKTANENIQIQFPIKMINISDDDGANPFREIDESLLKEINTPSINKIIGFNVHLPNHWITCILHKNGANMRYYITDSNGNTNQINNPLILRLIYYLETGIDDAQVSVKLNGETKKTLDDITTINSPSISIVPKDKLFDLSKDYVGNLPTVIQDTLDYLEGKTKGKSYSSLYVHGTSGIGKSKMIEGIARRTNRILIKCAAGKATSKYQASGSESIQEAFKLAKDIAQPVIILIEEIDTISRNSDSNVNSDDNKASTTINEELESIEGNPNIFVAVTTNNPSMILGSLESRLTNSLYDKILPLTAANALELLVRKYNAEMKTPFADNLRAPIQALLNDFDARSINAVIQKAFRLSNKQAPNLAQWQAAIAERRREIDEKNRIAEIERRTKELNLRALELQINHYNNTSHNTVSQSTRDNIRDIGSLVSTVASLYKSVH